MDHTKIRAPLTLKNHVRNSVQTVAMHSGISNWLAQKNHVRRILMLHGIGDSKMTQAEFYRVMSWLKRRYQIVPLGRMIEDIISNRPAPYGANASELAITFDDGLRNQFKLACPVIKELDLSATIFVCPGLVESGKWLWTHEARARMRRLSPDALAEWAAHVGAPSKNEDGLIAWMKTTELPHRHRLENCLRDMTPNFKPTQQEHDAYDPMDWNEVQAADAGPICIGSHTMTHPILPTLNMDQILMELQSSKDHLQFHLKRDVDLFCYPNGSSDERVRSIAKKIYRAALTTDEGVIIENQDLFALPRIPVTAQIPLLAWRMYRPWA